MAGAVVRSEGQPLGVQHLGGARLRDTGHPAVLAVRGGVARVLNAADHVHAGRPALEEQQTEGAAPHNPGASLGMSAAAGGTTGGWPFARVRVTKGKVAAG